MHDPKLDFCDGYLKFLSCDVDQKKFDEEGMTPLDHLSQGPDHEKLRALLTLYLEEQRKRQAIEACSETKAKIDELEKELSKLVGLNELKLQLRKWTKGVLLDERRRALGLRVGPRRPPHMASLGNPGTCKTMVARILGKLLFMVEILPTDKVTEKAEGGILFVDEAYRLIPMQKSDDKDYGLEALEEIMLVMDNGFCRRVTKFFTFDDFITEDLAKILHLEMKNQTEGSLLYGFKLDPSYN
ncbi:hypothetical protein L1987_59196 [Smallanthus sonchifolius]|uniref:Uncharacterized protein n=1 Tax=Smallanthus sonchifolius TaxID=185202 RepID=A0ACB9D5E6_9ASTR|nr:hypothetical protein L1987_59196 [Smallanthus sonchifolius]